MTERDRLPVVSHREQSEPRYDHPDLADVCVICSTPLQGILSLGFRAVGIRRSSRNPNLCGRCNTHAESGAVVELTVLFADISSFTEMTHELGPERTHEVVDAFLQMATRALVKHDAFIDKYVGDAVMAFFNIPIRRPDHAAEAVAAAEDVLAGLPELSARFGRDLNISVGIASGWARVGLLGSQDGKDYTAIGDVVNLAARLQGHAGPGEVVVDPAVYCAVADQYPDAPEEPVALKGFKDTTTAHWLNDAKVSPRPGSGQHARHKDLSLGTLLFAVLGAPCAAATLIGPLISPLAVTVGFGSAFGASGALWALGDAPIRFPILAIATLGALANLYTLWHAHRLRRQATGAGATLPMTRLERRRTMLLISTSALTLAVVAFEFYAHDQMIGQKSMMPML